MVQKNLDSLFLLSRLLTTAFMIKLRSCGRRDILMGDVINPCGKTSGLHVSTFIISYFLPVTLPSKLLISSSTVTASWEFSGRFIWSISAVP